MFSRHRPRQNQQGKANKYSQANESNTCCFVLVFQRFVLERPGFLQPYPLPKTPRNFWVFESVQRTKDEESTDGCGPCPKRAKVSGLKTSDRSECCLFTSSRMAGPRFFRFSPVGFGQRPKPAVPWWLNFDRPIPVKAFASV